MPAPFYPAIKSTTSGTPGTGAFTPNAAASGYRDWSKVPTGWIGLVRFEDGSAWELSYSYWNGTTLSRASTQLFDSSTGSALSLTSAATAAMVVDPGEVMSHVGATKFAWWIATTGASALTATGMGAPTVVGTAAAGTLASTNLQTQQLRSQNTSATTANAQAGWHNAAANLVLVSSTAGMGGYEFTCRFGPSQLPTGPRLFCGMTSSTFAANTAEPSALTAHVAVFGLDSTDTNIQLMVNSNAGACTKTDTGIPLAANGWYEACIWSEPGSTKVYGLLIRLDTGAIWFGSTTTDVPASGNFLFPQIFGGLNGSNTGTAFILHLASLVMRLGA